MTMTQSRPRANTIAHLDVGALAMFGNGGGDPHAARMAALGLSMDMGAMNAPPGFDYRGMSNAMGHHGDIHALPKLDTQHVNNLDMTNALHTAPPQANFGGFDLDQLFTPHTTINPAALHFANGGAPHSANVAFGYDPSTNPQIPVGADDFNWMRDWNMQQMAGGNDNETAIEESSPSRMSSGDSPGDYAESMTASQPNMPIQPNGLAWQPHEMQGQQQQQMTNGTFQLEALGNGLPNLDASNRLVSPNGLISPNAMHSAAPTGEAYFHPAMMHQQTARPQQLQQKHPSQADIPQAQNGTYMPNPGHSISNHGSNSPSISSSSMTGSARQSSVTSMSTDSFTDATRQALLNGLSQPSVFGGAGHRKYSQPSVSSPLSPGAARAAMPGHGPSLPSTQDIRRYIDAFLQYTLPHLPLCHVPTLSFDIIEQHASARGTPPTITAAQNAQIGGARCLILGMAAIGALYEYEHPASKELFDAAKKMISLYLEERRKVDISAAANGAGNGSQTPLWLVQAMLLTVIYGHHCGDRVAADIASNHIAALVSLARSAELSGTSNDDEADNSEKQQRSGDVQMTESNDVGANVGQQEGTVDLHKQWIEWKTGEERKRCLFAIFFLSSVLCIAYNQTPTIMNSEILLDLPCAEELWTAENAEEWQNRGGLAAAEATSIPFSNALSTLLTANQRQANNFAPSVYKSSNGMQSGEDELRPSTFGCMVLICALHNYIWETRSRHRGRDWTIQETEAMVAHIEPALNAWQAAWKANEHHKLERPNPFGMGPLSADSIPLLDLAFVRLYVNLGHCAEAFWRRDFDQMAEALASGSDADDAKDINGVPLSAAEMAHHRRASQLQDGEMASTRHERHLRKAAFYAADSLTIACSYNLTYADPTAHELPIQSAIGFFDCAQVLAEWSTTVQGRVGRYLGVLGRDPIDYSQVPAIMLLEAEDMDLLRKIEQICHNMEQKRLQQENLLAMDINNFNSSAMNSMANGVDLTACGLGSKILRIVALMLEKAVIWPITHVMAKALETEASHMDRRAEASLIAR